MGLKVNFWTFFLQTMGLKVKKKKLLIFLSLRLQNYIMIMFLRNFFGFMDILHINKKRKIESKSKTKNYLVKENK